MKLSILICTIPEREWFLNRLLACLIKQIGNQLTDETVEYQSFEIRTLTFDDIEVVIMSDNKVHSIGFKRNYLLYIAKGDYLCWTDDDDILSDIYIKSNFVGINKDVDCCSLTGIITENGKNPKRFIHSIKYDSWFERDNIYYRNTNHLNTVKSSIAKQMVFPDVNHSEDKSYSEQLLKSGLLKKEHWIEEPIYFYEYRSRK